MDGIINIEYPESLANSLRLEGEAFKKEIRESALVKLFEMGKLSSGTAARVLGISRIDFLDLLASYKVSVLGEDYLTDLREDISNA